LRDSRLASPSLTKSFRRLFYLLAVYPTFWPPLYGLINRLERSGFLGRLVKYYDENSIDMPSDYLEKMTDIEARVGIQQLKKYDIIINTKRHLAELYSRQLHGIKELQLPPIVDGATYSHYVPRVKTRETVLSKALDDGVQLGRLIEYSIPHMSSYAKSKSIKKHADIAEKLSIETINLPIYRNILKSSARITALWKR